METVKKHAYTPAASVPYTQTKVKTTVVFTVESPEFDCVVLPDSFAATMEDVKNFVTGSHTYSTVTAHVTRTVTVKESATFRVKAEE